MNKDDTIIVLLGIMIVLIYATLTMQVVFDKQVLIRIEDIQASTQ